MPLELTGMIGCMATDEKSSESCLNNRMEERMVPALYEYFKTTVIKAEEERLICGFMLTGRLRFPSNQVLRIVWLDTYEIVMLRLTQQDPLR